MSKLRQHADAMGHAESSFVRRILSRRVDLMRCGGHNGLMERSRRSEIVCKARDMRQVGLGRAVLYPWRLPRPGQCTGRPGRGLK